jgi:C1A family cysteine protease
MSAMSPFREDVELAGSFEALPHGEEYAAFVDTATVEPEADDREEEEFDFGEAEAQAEAAHPILRVFPVPTAVLEALSGGLSSVAVGLAVNAGYRDVTQLTNIVFYFRHPDMIGRKIRPDERELAREWIAIRDRIVKPALEPGSTGAVIDAASPIAAPTAAPTVTPDALSPDRLGWPGHSAEELAFMKAVYVRQRQRAKGDFVMDLPRSALAEIEGRWARKDAATAASALLAEARAALGSAHPGARIGIVSAYRPATRQFEIWQGREPNGRDKGSGFPHYYRQAIAEGIVREGDLSPAAVEKMAAYIGGYIASPGYSNHQDGLAFDFGTAGPGQKGLGKLNKKSWFHGWLRDNAARHHFRPLATEAWHWTYHPPAAASEVWAGEVAAPGIRANRIEVAPVPLLARHRGSGPDLVLRWNEMPSVPEEIDVAVHLHGFWYPRLRLPRDIEPVSGLNLEPSKGADGQGRMRPTLTVLPRGHDTGLKQAHGPYNAYTFPALVTKDGLTALVRFALDRFAGAVGAPAPRVGRLILTAHSGGGLALLKILRHNNPHQVHVFDALYWDPVALVEWAQRRIRTDADALATGASAGEYMPTNGGALRIFYQDRYRGGTRPNSLAVRKAIEAQLGGDLPRWYRVEASKYDHFQIPRRYGWHVLADASADVPDAYLEPIGRREAEASTVDSEESEAAFAETDAETVEPEWEMEMWEKDEEPEDDEHEELAYLDETSGAGESAGAWESSRPEGGSATITAIETSPANGVDFAMREAMLEQRLPIVTARPAVVIEECEPVGMGWLRDLPDYRDYTEAHEAIHAQLAAIGVAQPEPVSLPATIDLRAFCSPVEQQGKLNSCTANAVVGLVEYFERRAHGKFIDASRLFLYKATRNLLHWTGDRGAYLRSTMGALALFGVPPEEYWAYQIADFDKEPTAFCYSFGENYRAISYYRLDPPGTTPAVLLTRIKTNLSAGLPSVLGFTVYSSIAQAWTTGRIPYPGPGENVVGGHAVVAIGYDDNVKITNANAGVSTSGALLVRNSWGMNWGDHGYGFLPYDCVTNRLAVDFWSLLKQEWTDTGAFKA